MIDVDEQPIAWREHGPADGDLVLFLHGLGTTRTSWDHQLHALGDTRRCVAWDMPGYGASPLPDGALTFAGLADAIVGLTQRLGAARAHLVGLSFGGMHALHTALDHPEVVASLTLVDTSPAFGLDGDTTRQAWVDARLAPLAEGKTVADIAPDVIGGVSGSGFQGPDLEVAIASMARIQTQGFRAAVELLPTHDVEHRLAELTMPTLVVVGEEDHETPISYAEALANAIADSRLEIIGGAGHLTPLEAPATFNTTLRRFLDGLQ